MGGATSEARADSTDLMALAVAIYAVEATVLAGGLTTGLGSTVHVARGNVRTGWFISSYVFGALNLATGALLAMAAANTHGDTLILGLSTAHLSIAALDITMPSIGFARGQQQQATLRPVVLGGRDVGGRLWHGAGLQIGGF